MHSNTKSIYIIIPVHNRRHLTRNCLLSLRRQTFQDFTIVVIDDGCTDGTAEMIKNEFLEVVLLKGDGDLWWTGATNKGVKYVLENATKAEYILTLNDDTIFQPNYLETLIVCASRNKKSLIGSIAINNNRMIIDDGGVKINWCIAKFNFLVRGKKYQTIVNDEPSVVSVDVLSGRGTLIPLETFSEIGLFDCMHLPHYGSDYEFSYRAKKKGYNLFVNYGSILVTRIGLTDDINNESYKWKGFFSKLFSKASPFCIRYRWNFARLTCPKIWLPSYLFFDMVRILIRNTLKHLTYK